jgi:hypothetical protein
MATSTNSDLIPLGEVPRFGRDDGAFGAAIDARFVRLLGMPAAKDRGYSFA